MHVPTASAAGPAPQAAEPVPRLSRQQTPTVSHWFLGNGRPRSHPSASRDLEVIPGHFSHPALPAHPPAAPSPRAVA